MYYRGAAAAIVVYDITSQHSFQRAKTWVEELRKNGSPNMVVALAGNKVDLEGRAIPTEEGQQYAETNGLAFWETSAKEALNVEELFRDIAAKLPRTEQTPGPHGGIALDQQPVQRKAKQGCC